MRDRVMKKDQVFEGVRLEVTTSAGFDAVLDRLRNGMGRTSIPEIVELAQKADQRGRVPPRHSPRQRP